MKDRMRKASSLMYPLLLARCFFVYWKSSPKLSCKSKYTLSLSLISQHKIYRSLYAENTTIVPPHMSLNTYVRLFYDKALYIVLTRLHFSFWEWKSGKIMVLSVRFAMRVEWTVNVNFTTTVLNLVLRIIVRMICKEFSDHFFFIYYLLESVLWFFPLSYKNHPL